MIVCHGPSVIALALWQTLCTYLVIQWRPVTSLPQLDNPVVAVAAKNSCAFALEISKSLAEILLAAFPL